MHGGCPIALPPEARLHVVAYRSAAIPRQGVLSEKKCVFSFGAVAVVAFAVLLIVKVKLLVAAVVCVFFACCPYVV